jgi:carbon monoxide dehydrogenase subunit G
MTHAFTRSRTIDRPAEEVWRELTDWEQAAGWLGVDSITADGPTAAGTVLTFVTRGKVHTSALTAVEPGRSVTLRSVQGGVTADYTYAVEPAGDRSRVTVDADVRTRGAWTLVAPLIRLAIRRTDAGQLDRLDHRLTAG